MSIGSRIKRLRSDREWTQSRLAKQIGMGKQQVHRIEVDRQTPTVSTIIRLCQILGTTPNHLLGFDEFKADSALEAQIVARQSKVLKIKSLLDQL